MHGRVLYRCGCLQSQCRCIGVREPGHRDHWLERDCPEHAANAMRDRAQRFVDGDPSVSLMLDPVAFFGALGFDPLEFPEAREQIRRDRERLIDEARD